MNNLEFLLISILLMIITIIVLGCILKLIVRHKEAKERNQKFYDFMINLVKYSNNDEFLLKNHLDKANLFSMYETYFTQIERMLRHNHHREDADTVHEMLRDLHTIPRKQFNKKEYTYLIQCMEPIRNSSYEEADKYE